MISTKDLTEDYVFPHNTSLMPSQDSDVESGSSSPAAAASEIDPQLAIINDILEKKIDHEKIGEVHDELDTLRSYLSRLDQNAAVKYDAAKLEPFERAFEMPFQMIEGCPMAVLAIASEIAKKGVEKYKDLTDAQKKAIYAKHPPLARVELKLPDNRPRIFKMVDFIGSALGRAGRSMPSVFSNFNQQISWVLNAAIDNVNKVGAECNDVLKILKDFNTETDEFLSSEESGISSSDSSQDFALFSPLSPRKPFKSTGRNLNPTNAKPKLISVRSLKNRKSAVKASSFDEKVNNLIDNDDSVDDDEYEASGESYMEQDNDDDKLGGGFKKTRKRRRSIRKCKNKSAKKCLRKGKSKAKGKKYKNKSTKKRLYRKK
jgi:hypothetical protein